MSGYNKWSNVQGRKDTQDAKRRKTFQRVSRGIYMAVRAGGPDPTMNPALRLAIDKAKSANVPNDNIARIIKKVSSVGEEEHCGEVTYEEYGPSDVAVLVHALTGNRNRTVTNVCVAFTRNGGSLDEAGSANYMFDRKGYIVTKQEDHATEEDDMLEVVLEADGEDVETSPEVFEIYTTPEDFTAVRDTLEQAGYSLAQAELTVVLQTLLTLNDEQKVQLERLVNKLKDDDSVSKVFTSAESL